MREDCLDHGRGHVTKEGYATVRTQESRDIGACMLHRVVFHRKAGYLPPVVMHDCDNPRCINPSHLVAGDWGSNNKDRAAKGRSSKVRVDLRKLDYTKATTIRAKLANGATLTNLAKEYNVDYNSIKNIRDNRTYFAGA